MPRSTWTQHNFNGGEWSPLAYGRTDIQKYKNGLATCLNYVPTAQGGLTRRPGTKYIANTKNNAAVRLVSFEFSITQAYVIEFGVGYVRFYTNDGQLLSGGSPYEVSTPYGASDLADLQFAQSADVLYIAHPNYKPRKLQRNGATSWSLNTISFLDGPYILLNSTTTTLTPSATSGAGVTITASSTTGINGGAGFVANDVGRSLRFKSGSSWGWATITGYTDSTHVTVTVTQAFASTTASSVWRLGVWYGAEGSSTTAFYPRTVCFHQDRLVWAGASTYPNRIDGSNTSDYENYAPTNVDATLVDSNAISFSLNATKVNVINWLVSDEWGMLAGTASGEWVIAPSNQQNAITPTNVTAKMTTAYGGANVAPVRMGKATLFVQRTKRKLREMSYQFTIGSFQAPDVSLIGEHLTKSGIKQMAATQAPQPVLWIVRTDGTLVGMSYDKDQDILGWHQHQLGGYSDSGQSVAPVVESVAVIPSPTTDRDEVWLSVQRYVNGAVVRTVELMQKFWEDGDTLTNAYFVDCGATYSGSATTSVTGLTWLKGQTVSVLADGSVHPDCTVDNTGAITLNRSASTVQVGLGYNSDGKTLRIEAGGADGGAQGKIKRIHRAIFRFFQSVGLNVQSTGGTAFPEPFRTSADKMSNPVALYTGDKRWAWDGSYELEGQVFWRQNEPLPSNVLMVVAQLETQDGG
jgi:hypothetical protein